MDVSDLNLIFVDVEATDDTPMTGVMCDVGAIHYHSGDVFGARLWETEPDPALPVRPRLTGGRQLPGAVRLQLLHDFSAWALSFGSRPILVSDNPGYDAMWVACTFASFGIVNPFGHSSRRIGDFYAGLVNDFHLSSKWKKMRITPHTHDPVDDARGNVEAFRRMISGERC